MHQHCLSATRRPNEHEPPVAADRCTVDQDGVLGRHREHVHQCLLGFLHSTNVRQADVRREKRLVRQHRRNEALAGSLEVSQSEARGVAPRGAALPPKELRAGVHRGLYAGPVHQPREVRDAEAVDVAAPVVQGSLSDERLVHDVVGAGLLPAEYPQDLGSLLQLWGPQGHLVLHCRMAPEHLVNRRLIGQRCDQGHPRARRADLR
mmetsp:Transcript_68780/g.201428  ORF Transcript_68780/g.201428 Transcript_68780/m.201428 type:complete len:206 (+) Transcript_68780:864-1481(+)